MDEIHSSMEKPPAQSRAKARVKDIAAKCALALASLVIGLVLCEFGLRLIYPITVMNMEVQGPAKDGDSFYTADRTIGLRPILGTSLYDDNGVLVGRSVVSKSTEPRKVLFIGDSVTARAAIVSELAKQGGSGTTSYLNGGVEGYNIQQEVDFFLQYQTGIKPQAIVHQWHINDLRSSRWLMRGSDGRVRIYSHKSQPEDEVDQWLYQNSQLYRFWIANFRSRFSSDELHAAAVDALRRMRAYTREHGIAYHAILFPVMEPLSKWPQYDKQAHADLLKFARDLEIPIVDLTPVSERLIAAGIDPQERPGDTSHPNQAFGKEAAQYMRQHIPALGSDAEPTASAPSRGAAYGRPQ